MQTRRIGWSLIFTLTTTTYALWTYLFTDPNLVLTSHPLYWNAQQYLWQVAASRGAEVTTYWYLFLLAAVTFSWLGVVSTLERTPLTLSSLQSKHWWAQTGIWLLLPVIPLFFSYNALSHDLFNYIFNSKMVLIYKQNPHIHTALEFPNDTWIRFMHNTHTPAPYGYAWTALSLIPFSLGFGKFTLTWFIFKGWMWLSWLSFWLSIAWLNSKKTISINTKTLALILLHPLMILEVLSNAHNDLWMMVPAVVALALVSPLKHKTTTQTMLSIALLAASIVIKQATVVLVPIYAALLLQPYISQREKIKHYTITYWAPLATLGLTVILISERSKQFLPWYLLWAISTTMLFSVSHFTSKVLKTTLLIWGVLVLLRYTPWLFANTTYEWWVDSQQKTITWIALPISFTLACFFKLTLNKKNKPTL